jgi:four helix bundle protein
MRNFRELVIWQDGMELAELAYDAMRGMPHEEIYGLTKQIKRCAVSIPSNIAEGCSRSSNRDFKHFLEISLGSAFEEETQLLLATRLRMIEPNSLQSYFIKHRAFESKTNKFISRLKDFD